MKIEIEKDKLQAKLVQTLRLLTKRTHETACVLLEDKATEKFIQFGRGPELILDLPLNCLTEQEKQRAREIFLTLGSNNTKNIEAPDVDGEPITRNFEVLQHNFGGNADDAAIEAIRVFQHTYQLNEPVYVLHDN